MNPRIHRSSAAAAALLSTPGLALAQAADDAPAASAAEASRLSFSAGLDVTSAYFFRGYLQEDQGLIAQPWAEVGIDLTPEGAGYGLGLAVGTWGSLHSEKTGANGTGHRAWYEQDLYTTLSLEYEAFTVSLNWSVFAYPNNTAFNTVQEMGLTIGYDIPDDHVLNPFLGGVSVTLVREIDNSNVGNDGSSYLQLDVGPSFELEGTDITISIPVSVGWSLDDYYVGAEDEDFGFLSVGAVADIPLPGSGAYGEWSLSLGVGFLMLGDTTEALNNGDDSEFVASAGVSVAF